MRDNVDALQEFHATIPHLEGSAQTLDLENVVNALTGVGSARVQGNEVQVCYDPDYISETTLRKQLAESGYPTAESAPE